MSQPQHSTERIGKDYMSILSKLKGKRLSGRKLSRTCAASIVSAAIVLIILTVAFSVQGVAPFGDGSRTLTCMDATIQYNDFLAWYQDVLRGDASVLYSFSKGLGANAIALFSYYLSSPFNPLFLLVPKESIHILFDIVVMLKLATAGITASIFFSKRFIALPLPLAVCLSVGYALMQYSLAQASNIMWLDGVYMLPLMALFASRLIASGQGVVPLSIATGLSILFNWYSGAINCLYLILWFFFELVVHADAPVTADGVSRYVLLRGLKFAAVMLLGVGLSMALLLPTAFSLMGGRASGGALVSLQWGSFSGNPLKFFGGIVIGSTSSPDFASFYCGSLIMIGFVALILSRKVTAKIRVAAAVFGMILVLSCYYQPLFTIFSLLISSTSYWFRFGYVCIFGFAAMAGIYYDACFSGGVCKEGESPVSARCMFAGMAHSRYREALLASILLSIAVLGFHAIRPYAALAHAIITCIAMVLTGILLTLFGREVISGAGACRFKSLGRVRPCSAALLVTLCAELALNAVLLLGPYSTANADDRAEYVRRQVAQVDDLLGQGPVDYRVNQYPTYLTEETGLTANYNEGMAFGYPTLVTYSSDPVDAQRQLLNALGYPICGDNMNIVNTPNLAADSLLGVRYYLLDRELPGLVPEEGISPANGKSAYRNPYALPLAFSIDASLPEDLPVYDGNPFEFINGVYSTLLGRKVDLFIPMPATSSSLIRDSRALTTYELVQQEGMVALYGNIRLADQWIPSTLRVNGGEYGYSQWLSPTVFYIDGEDPSVTIDADAANTVVDAQFYALDLNLLDSVVEELESSADAKVRLGSNTATIDIDNAEDVSTLFTSIPFDDGWTVTVNGAEVSPERTYGCLMSIPLVSGENHVELSFTPRGFVLGCMISGFSTACLGVLAVRDFRRGMDVERGEGDYYEN